MFGTFHWMCKILDSHMSGPAKSQPSREFIHLRSSGETWRSTGKALPSSLSEVFSIQHLELKPTSQKSESRRGEVEGYG